MKFTETHEWALMEGGLAVVGVSQHAQHELGDIVYVELPKTGKIVKAGEEAAVLESTKAAADVYSPLSGTIVEVNEKLSNSPELINQAPETDAWLFKLKPSQPQEWDQLLTKEDYLKKIS